MEMSLDRIRAQRLVYLLTWIATAVRLYQLGAQSLWFDEAFSWLCATALLPQAFQSALTDFVHPPLYYLLLRPLMVLGEGEFQLRLFSAWMGVASVPLMYVLACRLINRSVGLLAAALLALNPFHIWYSQEARMYTLLFLLTLGTGYFFEQVITAGGKWNWTGLGVTGSLAYVTHYFALLLPLAQFVFLLLSFRRYYRLLRRWTVVQVLASIPLGVWVYFLYRLPERAMGVGWIPRPVLWDPLVTLWNFSLGFPDQLRVGVVLGLLPFTVALIRAARAGRRRRWWWTWLVLPMLFVLFLSWATGRYFYVDRFFMVCLPAYLLLVAWGTLNLPAARVRRWMMVALLVTLPFGPARIFLDPALDKEDWRGAVALVNRLALPGDKLVMDRGAWWLTVRYYQGVLPVTSLSSASLQQLWEPGQGEGRIWLLYRNPSESAHLPTRPGPFDIFTEADPATAEWLQAHRDLVTEHFSLASIDVLLIEAPSTGGNRLDRRTVGDVLVELRELVFEVEDARIYEVTW